MISKQQQKYIQSLHNKKYRTEYREFIVEGEKSIAELLNSTFTIKALYVTERFIEKHPNTKNYTLCSEKIIRSVSTFKSNNAGVAIVEQKPNIQPNHFDQVTLILDNINDPGNLGTIIRLADWYGLTNIICNKETVEFYNPKVIASTMGSFLRVRPYYTDLNNFIEDFEFPIYGADMIGENVHHYQFEEKIALVIGSESHGISKSLTSKIKSTISIPRFGKAESLNAAMATGIILDNFFRQL